MINEYADPFNEIVKKERYAELYHCIALLSLKERKLIYALFWQEMSETDYAKLIGRQQSSVNEMKHRILAKLKKKLKNK